MLTQQTCQILLIKGRKTQAVSSQLVPPQQAAFALCFLCNSAASLSPVTPRTRHSRWASAVIPWGASQGNRCPRAGQKPVVLSCEPVNHMYSHQYNAWKRNRAGREQSKDCSCYARLLKWSGVTILGGPIMQGNSHVPVFQQAAWSAAHLYLCFSLESSTLTVIIMSPETKFTCCCARVCLCYCSPSGEQAWEANVLSREIFSEVFWLLCV